MAADHELSDGRWATVLQLRQVDREASRRRGLSRAYFRSISARGMNRARRSIDGRYPEAARARPATVNRQRPGLSSVEWNIRWGCDERKGTVVVVANANRPASAIYTPAYGQSVAGATGTSAHGDHDQPQRRGAISILPGEWQPAGCHR